jgi:hypothetical protein
MALGLPLASAPLAGCDKSGPLAELDAGPVWPVASSATVAAVVVDAGPPARVMPPRPVPTSSPTVRITMPIEVQLQAIQYMEAMQAPQPGDASADPAYARSIADAFKSLGKTDVISSGRRIDVMMGKGCDATLPKSALARQTGASLATLLAHGVLVLKCVDHEVQCLQSTRDADDVLCTHR